MKKIILLTLIVSINTAFGQQKKLFEKSETEPFLFVEKMPDFPGGESKLMDYLQKNIHYPAQALEKDIQGRVMVEFIVCEDGSICDLKIIKELDKSTSNEVISVMSKMPNWTPGYQDGKPVRVIYSLPIDFNLASNDKEIKELSLTQKELMNFSFSKTNKIKSFHYNYNDKEGVKVSNVREYTALNKLINSAKTGDTFRYYNIRLNGIKASEFEYKFTIE